MFRKFRKNKSIFSYLLLGMCMLILAETAILSESLRVGGIYEKLNQNAKDIVDQKVINRSASLQNEMVNNWSDLSKLADNIIRLRKNWTEREVLNLKHWTKVRTLRNHLSKSSRLADFDDALTACDGSLYRSK
mgnify:CR=1 FL=1